MVDLIDTNGVKPTLKKGVLGYDDYSVGGDAGRLYVGTGTASIAQAKKSEVDSHTSNVSNPHSVTKTQVGLGNVDNTSDANKPISSATQSALDAKAPLSNPTFTGTVSGITKSMVGLGNVDNTSDVNKPVSTATQTALNTKVDKVTSTDNAIVRFDGTTGLVQNSGVIIDDSNNINLPFDSSVQITGNKYAFYDKSGGKPNSYGALEYKSDWYGDSPYFKVIVNNLERMRIDSNGNVGIGTGSNINAKLDVQGSIRQYNPGTTANSVINHVNDSKNWYVGLRGDSSSAYSIADETRQRLLLDTTGNTLHLSPLGGLGYGTGAGGQVTQLTSKSTAVTLNKPSGQITMNNAALAAGASVYFTVQNSLVAGSDNINAIGVYATVNPANYKIEPCAIYTGNFQIRVTNITGGALAEALIIEYTVIKGAVA